MKENKFRKLKSTIISILKLFFCNIYYLSTISISILIFAIVLFKKDSIIYAYAISFIAFIIIDIICSILEDFLVNIIEFFSKLKNKKQKLKEEKQRLKEKEMEELTKLLNYQNNYSDEIEGIKIDLEEFKKKINQEKLSKTVTNQLNEIFNKMDELIKILKLDPQEFYPIRHTFRVYFPNIKRMTYQYINILRTTNLDKEENADYIKLIKEFNNYLNFIKNRINTKDKLSLNVDIKAMIKIIEAERKKG